MEEFKRIMVVTRMTQYCHKAVHQGVSLSRKYGAQLFVLHSVHNPFSYKGWNLPIVSLEKEYQENIEKQKKRLDEIISREQSQGLTIEVLVREGEPTQAVVEVVKEKEIDLIILLAHEEGHLEHFLFGRSNEALVRMIPCSILLVKKELAAVGY
jgi:universal stress protein A